MRDSGHTQDFGPLERRSSLSHSIWWVFLAMHSVDPYLLAEPHITLVEVPHPQTKYQILWKKTLWQHEAVF